MNDIIDRFSRIMVFVDGSDTSITAAQYAICLAKVFNTRIYAVYVVDEKILTELLKARIFIKEEALDYEHDLEEDGKRYLNHIGELAREKSVECEPVLLRGEVNVEVLKQIKELDIDVLIINEMEELSSRREAFFDEKERILRKSPCPVIVVKDEEKVQDMYDSL